MRGLGVKIDSCSGGEELIGNKCYSGCQPGFTGHESKCYKDCADGTISKGSFCPKPENEGRYSTT